MTFLPRTLLATLFAATGLSVPPAFAADPPAEGFLCCNMRTDGNWISDINYEESGKSLIPMGTPVKFKGYGRNRVEVEIGGKTQYLGNDYSRDLAMDVFAQRYIVSRNPRQLLASMPPRIREAVNSARLTTGMTREQVVMAVGYPVSSETASLNAPAWKFWLWSFSPFTVHFDSQGRVARIETDPETMTKVVLR
jgi:hypothetical protein